PPTGTTQTARNRSSTRWLSHVTQKGAQPEFAYSDRERDAMVKAGLESMCPSVTVRTGSSGP
ncbi:hypothetical protein ABT116_49750, partial [Streptomyces sp. NPDC002130]|uniref:hypothetical protein n=1 Tax=Streptomyces sp. NPDC002130 TaxID=3155568 RepID=UPI00332BBA77